MSLLALLHQHRSPEWLTHDPSSAWASGPTVCSGERPGADAPCPGAWSWLPTCTSVSKCPFSKGAKLTQWLVSLCSHSGLEPGRAERTSPIELEGCTIQLLTSAVRTTPHTACRWEWTHMAWEDNSCSGQKRWRLG